MAVKPKLSYLDEKIYLLRTSSILSIIKNQHLERKQGQKTQINKYLEWKQGQKTQINKYLEWKQSQKKGMGFKR